MRTRGNYSTLSVSLFFANLLVCFHINFIDLPACFLLVFLGLQLTDFNKTVSFGRQSAFHDYFGVSSPDEWLRILLVAI